MHICPLLNISQVYLRNMFNVLTGYIYDIIWIRAAYAL
jgi:hypothetical protein